MKKVPAIQQKEIQRTVCLRSEKMKQRSIRLEELSISDPSYLSALDMKTCVMEVEDILLRQLAAEENRKLETRETPVLPITESSEHFKGLEALILSLQY